MNPYYELYYPTGNGELRRLLRTSVLDSLVPDMHNPHLGPMKVKVVYPNERELWLNNRIAFDQYREDFYEQRYNYKLDEAMNTPDDEVIEVIRNTPLVDYIKNNRNPDPEIKLQPPTEKKTMNDAINPKHYQDIIPGMQYIQMMEYLLKDHEGVAAHLLGQIYKYCTRLGKKDSLEQDASKIAWYACCLRDYYKNGSIPKELNY